MPFFAPFSPLYQHYIPYFPDKKAEIYCQTAQRFFQKSFKLFQTAELFQNSKETSSNLVQKIEKDAIINIIEDKRKGA